MIALDSNITQQILSILVVVLGIVLVAVFLLLLRLAYGLMYRLKASKIFLEITPPAFQDKPVDATESLFTAIHALGMHRTFWDKLLNRQSVFAFEIVSSKKEGIRFYVVAPKDNGEVTEKTISSYLNDAKIKHVEDPIKWRKHIRVLEFKQAKHFAYPLKNYEELQDHDPLGYITSAMTKLDNEEQLGIQITLKPSYLREADILRRKILRNESFMPESGMRSGVWLGLLKIINSMLFGLADAFSMTYHYKENSYGVSSAQKDLEYKKQLARGDKPVRTLSYFEHEVIESVSQKLKRPLFKTDIRVVVSGSDKQQFIKHRKAINSALGLFEVPKYQLLKLKRRKFIYSKKILHLFTQKRLVSSWVSPNYFAASELAGLYHFPHSISGKTENVIKSLSKSLPAPISLKSNTKLDVLIGQNKHHNQSTQIGLTESERERHMYVIGGTGNGKTTMLKYQIVQDIQNGKGVAVVDPHGDLAEELLGYIPEDRLKDVIYINPDDLAYPVGINLLELPEGLSGDELLREKDIVTESTVSVLRKIFSEDDSGGHRIEYVLRNTIQTALTMDECNLFTIFRLLNDNKYRKSVVNKLENEDLKIFWKNELGKAGEMQKIKMAAGITSKIGRFLFSASAKRILEQNKSTINFDKIMDEKKILICNFSKGLLGEDTSMLFGVTILAKLQLASLRRARQLQSDRTSYYLYVDEFQNFATMSFVQMLSEARKYKLFLVMAEQSTQQQEEQRLVDIILANVGTVIAFRSGSPADERLILPLFRPYIEEGEISNLPAYNFYARISAINTQEPMSGETVLLNTQPSDKVAKSVKEASRESYGKVVVETKPAVTTKSPRKNDLTNKNKGASRKKSIKDIKKFA